MKKLNKNKIALGLATLVMGLGGNAMAAEQTGTAQVNASVLPSCKVDLPKNIETIYTPASTVEQTSRTGTFTVTCTKTTPFEMGLSGSEYSRYMLSGDNYLSYGIFLLSHDKYFWGEIGSPNSFEGQGKGVIESMVFELKITPGQYVPLGSYSDELVVTFNY